MQQIADCAYVTGWRKSEILSLQWRQVDFEAGNVRLEPGTTKNREARQFPFTSELRKILEGQKAKRDALAKDGKICPWVFQPQRKADRRIQALLEIGLYRGRASRPADARFQEDRSKEPCPGWHS